MEIWMDEFLNPPFHDSLLQASGAQGFNSGFTLQTFDASGLSLTNDNIVAVEVHTYVIWAWEIEFDLYISATGSSCSTDDFFGAST